MADDRYRINFDNDLTPAFALLGGALRQRKADARSNEYLQMEKEAIRSRAERESAQAARDKAELDRKHAIEAYSAMPMLQRAAAKSVGMANMNPYGVHFDETMQQPDQTKADAGVGSFLANDQPPEQAPAPERQLLPNEEGPEQFPDAEAGRFAGPEELMSKATGGAPLDALSAAAAASFAPPTKKLTATYGGHTFDVPDTTEKTPFGPKYDEMVNYFIDNGDSPKDAHARVVAIYKAEQSQNAIADRTAQSIEARRLEAERSRPDVATQEDWLNRRLAQSEKNTRIGANSRVAAAGAGPVSPVVPELIRMTEEGAPASDVYSKAAEAKVSQKQFQAPIQNVVKNAAAGERASQKREALTATDDRGNVIGTWRDANSAKIGSQQIERFHRVKERLEALIHHVESQGDRVLTPNEVQERLSYGAAVVAALRPFNELSNTAAGQKAEELIVSALGAPGHGFLMGANANILKHLLTEAEGQYRANLNTKLRPGGGSQLAPALGGPRKGQGAGHSDAIRAKAQRALDDPNAPPEAKDAARRILGL